MLVLQDDTLCCEECNEATHLDLVVVPAHKEVFAVIETSYPCAVCGRTDGEDDDDA